MNQEQIQQLMNQQMLEWFSAVPFWMKAGMVLQLLSILATVICLPLITWKLYFGNKPASPTALSWAEQGRLQHGRDRRQALQNLSTPTPPVSSGDVREETGNDSRYMPKD